MPRGIQDVKTIGGIMMMTGDTIPDHAVTCPSFNEVVRIFLSEKYSPVLDEYCSMLHSDPEYLSYHGTSTALKLQFQLKLKDLPSLCIGGCLHGGTMECCIVAALKEAILQRESPSVTLMQGKEPAEASRK
jgi:hypothetical protein